VAAVHLNEAEECLIVTEELVTVTWTVQVEGMRMIYGLGDDDLQNLQTPSKGLSSNLITWYLLRHSRRIFS
jgi:hypothetical protein